MRRRAGSTLREPNSRGQRAKPLRRSEWKGTEDTDFTDCAESYKRAERFFSKRTFRSSLSSISACQRRQRPSWRCAARIFPEAREVQIPRFARDDTLYPLPSTRQSSLHRTPSFTISSSASRGPQVPAAYVGI